jgi:hypothetical protein
MATPAGGRDPQKTGLSSVSYFITLFFKNCDAPAYFKPQV